MRWSDHFFRLEITRPMLLQELILAFNIHLRTKWSFHFDKFNRNSSSFAINDYNPHSLFIELMDFLQSELSRISTIKIAFGSFKSPLSIYCQLITPNGNSLCLGVCLRIAVSRRIMIMNPAFIGMDFRNKTQG